MKMTCELTTERDDQSRAVEREQTELTGFLFFFFLSLFSLTRGEAVEVGRLSVVERCNIWASRRPAGTSTVPEREPEPVDKQQARPEARQSASQPSAFPDHLVFSRGG